MMLKMHFLNVGHGDCCIIEFSDRTTMVDINRSTSIDDKSVKEIVSAIKRKHPDRKVEDLTDKGYDSNTVLENVGYKIKP